MVFILNPEFNRSDVWDNRLVCEKHFYKWCELMQDYESLITFKEGFYKRDCKEIYIQYSSIFFDEIFDFQIFGNYENYKLYLDDYECLGVDPTIFTREKPLYASINNNNIKLVVKTTDPDSVYVNFKAITRKRRNIHEIFVKYGDFGLKYKGGHSVYKIDLRYTTKRNINKMIGTVVVVPNKCVMIKLDIERIKMFSHAENVVEKLHSKGLIDNDVTAVIPRPPKNDIGEYYPVNSLHITIALQGDKYGDEPKPDNITDEAKRIEGRLVDVEFDLESHLLLPGKSKNIQATGVVYYIAAPVSLKTREIINNLRTEIGISPGDPIARHYHVSTGGLAPKPDYDGFIKKYKHLVNNH